MIMTWVKLLGLLMELRLDKVFQEINNNPGKTSKFDLLF
jgi:hypothetical protein